MGDWKNEKKADKKKEKRVGLIDSMLKHFPPIETILVHTKEDTSLHCQTLLGLFSCRERISLTPSLFCFVSFFVFFSLAFHFNLTFFNPGFAKCNQWNCNNQVMLV